MELKIWNGLYDEKSLEGYEIVCWPDSQDLFELEDYREHSYLINDEEGLDMYASSAYVVEKDWLRDVLSK